MIARAAVAGVVGLLLAVLPTAPALAASSNTGNWSTDSTWTLTESAWRTAPDSFTIQLKSNKAAPAGDSFGLGVWVDIKCSDGSWGKPGLWSSWGFATLYAGVTEVENNVNQYCGAPNTVSGLRFYQCTMTAGNCGQRSEPILVEDLSIAGAPSTTCTALTSATVSYVGGVLAADVRFKGTPPAGGFRVFVPGTQYPGTGTPQLTVDPSTNVPGDYFKSATVTLSGVTGSTVFRVESAAASGCYLTGQVNVTFPAVQGTAASGSDQAGNDCGLNFFCMIQSGLSWAFVPDDASKKSVSDQWNRLGTKFPFGVVSWFSDQAGNAMQCTDSDGSGTGCGQVYIAYHMPEVGGVGGGSCNHFGGTYGCTFIIASESTPILESSFMTRLHTLRPFLGGVVWLGLLGGIAWSVYRWATPFGVLASWGARSYRSGGDDE